MVEGVPIRSALVVDDQEPHRKLAAMLLLKLGIPFVYNAANGRSGLESAYALKPDLIVCDIDMPDLDGMAMLRGLRDLQPQPEIIILSSVDASMLNTVHRLARDYDLPVLGALPKPAHIDTLRELLDRSHRRRLAPLASTQAQAAVLSDAVLLEALEQNRYEPYMEPKIERASGRVVGVEMLARLRLDTASISPNRFISRLESLGRIDTMTWQLAEKSLQWLAGWHAQGLSLALSFNLSPLMIELDGMVDRLTDLTRQNGLSPQHVTIEITESVAISSRPETLEVLARLRLRGFGLSIDDFGTGYSSMSQLSSVPFSELKIDRLFTAAAEEDYKARAVVESSIQLARKLGLKVCAEGVEQAAMFRMLYDLGVDYMQGYQFSRPMPAAEFADWARAWNARMTARRLYVGE